MCQSSVKLNGTMGTGRRPLGNSRAWQSMNLLAFSHAREHQRQSSLSLYDCSGPVDFISLWLIPSLLPRWSCCRISCLLLFSSSYSYSYSYFYSYSYSYATSSSLFSLLSVNGADRHAGPFQRGQLSFRSAFVDFLGGCERSIWNSW